MCYCKDSCPIHSWYLFSVFEMPFKAWVASDVLWEALTSLIFLFIHPVIYYSTLNRDLWSIRTEADI